MRFLKPDETRVLRITLGLHESQRRSPTRNGLHPAYAEQYREAVDALLARGLLHVRSQDCGRWKAGELAATDAGRTAVLDEPWK